MFTGLEKASSTPLEPEASSSFLVPMSSKLEAEGSSTTAWPRTLPAAEPHRVGQVPAQGDRSDLRPGRDA